MKYHHLVAFVTAFVVASCTQGMLRPTPSGVASCAHCSPVLQEHQPLDGSIFGIPGGCAAPAMEGRLYDLKQSRTGALTDKAKALNAVDKSAARSFIENYLEHWNLSRLCRNFSAGPLEAHSFCFPVGSSAAAPAAFGVQDKVSPVGWLVLYRGKVRAPKAGTFRFVGVGEGALAVRFKGRTVLVSGSLQPMSLFGRDCHVAGQEISVRAGEVCPMEILISDFDGSQFSAALMIEDVTAEREGKNLRPFRLTAPQAVEENAPHATSDDLNWTVVP